MLTSGDLKRRSMLNQACEAPYTLFDLPWCHGAEWQADESVTFSLSPLLRICEESRAGREHEPDVLRPADEVLRIRLLRQHHANEEPTRGDESLGTGQLAAYRARHRLPAGCVQVLQPLYIRREEPAAQVLGDRGLRGEHGREVRIFAKLRDGPN